MFKSPLTFENDSDEQISIRKSAGEALREPSREEGKEEEEVFPVTREISHLHVIADDRRNQFSND